MHRISKCDLCLANSSTYALWIRNAPMLRSLDSMHVLDAKFLLENYKHYKLKLNLISSDKAEKEHDKKQLDRILWIFEQYGLSKAEIAEYFKYQYDMLLLNKIKDNKKRRTT